MKKEDTLEASDGLQNHAGKRREIEIAMRVPGERFRGSEPGSAPFAALPAVDGGTMKERPILFSSLMVRALLAADKTQTRRVIVPQPNAIPKGHQYAELAGPWFTEYWRRNGMWEDAGKLFKCPYGEKGDRLWVRENLVIVQGTTREMVECGHYAYQADDTEGIWTKQNGFRVIPSIHMPRFASRITLGIDNIGVQRLQEIDGCDALEEGVPDLRTDQNGWDMVDCFRYTWNHINYRRGYGWHTNPWVWVIRFKVNITEAWHGQI